MTAGGADDGRKRDRDGASDMPDSKRPRVTERRKGWGQGLRKKAPDKKHEGPSSSMVTAVLIAALSSSAAVKRPTMQAVKTEDLAAAEETGSTGADDQVAGSESSNQPACENSSSDPAAPAEAEKQPQSPVAPPAPQPAPPVPMSKEELLLTIDTTDSEIAKLEARLAELNEEDEAEAQENDDASRPAVLPIPSDYNVDFVDLRGQQAHSLYIQNTKTGILAKRKQMPPRLMPYEVLEQVASGAVLYSEPQDLSSYHENIASHRKMRLSLIEILMNRRETVKRKNNKLLRQWHVLNNKYENKQRPRGGHSNRDALRGSARGTQPRSSLRSSPRDTGVARSDVEFNAIIHKLEEEERARHRYEFNLAQIPQMMVDPVRREASLFISKNALVEDPVHETRIFSIMDIWNEQERQQFFDKYMSFPKNFRKIAGSLPYKNTQDCIRFYYRYKKELDLKTKLKQHQLKKRGPGKKASAAAATTPKLEAKSWGW